MSVRRVRTPVSSNPFDNDNGSFFVLDNDEEQHGLWPFFTEVPTGWRVVYGAAERAACVDFAPVCFSVLRRAKRGCDSASGGLVAGL
jgi:uncharacterized protein YbdZ (MbtH family)